MTADGKPVTDLTQADFEVKEDGVVQAIRSFEAIVHTPQPVGMPRRNPSTVAESNAMIADPRRRVFVVFLDTFHVDRGSSMVVRKALQDFLKTALGPDDLVAYMTPHMSGMDISFSSSTEPLIRYLDDNPIWGVADESPGTETDEIERNLQSCFVGDKEMDATWLALRSRLREQKSIQALSGLVSNLDGLRESRKAVIAVTMGWRLFRENENHMSDKGTQGRVVGVDPLGVGPDGKLGFPDRNRINGSSDKTCDNVRMQASSANSQQMFLDLIGQANRSSTSFYTLDAAGLRTEGRPQPGNALEAAVEARNRERVPYSTRLDSIRTLGEATNGMAIVDTNNFAAGLQRAAADFNSYYLLGYTSTNGKPDGRYRKIKVTVKRPGVQVRAREGYLARRADEGPAKSTSNSASPGASGSDERESDRRPIDRGARPADAVQARRAAGRHRGGRRGARRHGALDPRHRGTRCRGGRDTRMGRGRGGAGVRAQRQGRHPHVGEGRAGQGRADGGDRSARRRGHDRRREGAGARCPATARWRATRIRPASRSTRCRPAGAPRA